MSELNPLSNEQIFLKKIAENTGSDYNTGDVSEINPLTIDQILLKEIAANTAGQSGDITELEEKVTANTGAIEAIVNEYGAKNLAPTLDFTQKVDNDITWTVIRENGSNNGKVTVVGTSSGWSVMPTKDFYLPAGTYVISDGAPSRNTYVELKKSSDASKIVNTADGDSQTFTLSQDTTVYVLYAIRSGVTVNDVFAVQIRDVRITDPTYVPYAMTNRELTERLLIVDVPIDTVTLTAGETANLNISSVVPSGYIPVSVSYVSDNNYGLCYSMVTQFVNDNWFLLFQNTTNSSVTLKGHTKISMLKYSI